MRPPPQVISNQMDHISTIIPELMKALQDAENGQTPLTGELKALRVKYEPIQKSAFRKSLIFDVVFFQITGN